MTKKTSAPKTTFVGIKEFRRDVAKYASDAREGKQRVVVTSRNKPLFVVTPLPEETYSEGLIQAVQKAEADQQAGRVYSQSDVEAMFR